METAAARGDGELVRWLHTASNYTTWIAIEAAASHHHLDLALWLAEKLQSSQRAHSFRNPPVRILAHTAAVDGSLTLLHWSVFKSGKVYRRCFATMRALIIEENEEDLAVGYDMFDAMAYAASEGDLHALQELHEDQVNRWPRTHAVARVAAAGGHIGILQWLHAVGACPISESAAIAGANDGHLRILEWMCDKAIVPLTVSVAKAACGSPNVDCIQWVCERIPTCVDQLRRDNASVYSVRNTNVLMWLCERGAISADSRVLNKAAIVGDVVVFRHVLDSFLPEQATEEVLRQSFISAAAHGNTRILEYISTHLRRWWPEAFLPAVTGAHVHTVEFLLGIIPAPQIQLVSVRALSHNALHGRLEMVQLLLEHHLVDLVEGATTDFAWWFDLRGKRETSEVPGLLERRWTSLYRPEQRSREARFEAYVRCTMHHELWKYCDFSVVPHWAVLRGRHDILTALIDCGYPAAFSAQVLESLRQSSACSVFLRAIRHAPTADICTQVSTLRWAVRFHDLELIQFLVEQAVADECIRLHIIALTGARHGHVEVLAWVVGRLRALGRPSSVDPWRGVLSMAQRSGHTTLVVWLTQVAS